jgi:general secretion pathway protein I
MIRNSRVYFEGENKISNTECRRVRPLHHSKFGVRYSIFKGFACSGFTLLEVLVALSLLGIAVVAVIQLFSIDLRSISVSEDYVAGTLAAQSKMREVLSAEDMAEKNWKGVTDDGYQFEVSISRSLKDRTEELQVRMYEITVTVSWTKGFKQRSMTLRTQKLVQKLV